MYSDINSVNLSHVAGNSTSMLTQTLYEASLSLANLSTFGVCMHCVGPFVAKRYSAAGEGAKICSKSIYAQSNGAILLHTLQLPTLQVRRKRMKLILLYGQMCDPLCLPLLALYMASVYEDHGGQQLLWAEVSLRGHRGISRYT